MADQFLQEVDLLAILQLSPKVVPLLILQQRLKVDLLPMPQSLPERVPRVVLHPPLYRRIKKTFLRN
jgi:hypothetical protein